MFQFSLPEFGLYRKCYVIVCPGVNRAISGFDKKELGKHYTAILVESRFPVRGLERIDVIE